VASGPHFYGDNSAVHASN